MAEILVPLGFFIMVVCLVVGTPIARAYARRMDAQRNRLPLATGDVTARLERIEQALEAIATEVERIAEGQRFTTKLLSEPRHEQKAALPAPAPEGTVLSETSKRP
jgi:hypothetical protein